MSLKRAAYAAFAALALLCVGAILFYKERMLFTDASLVSFRRINAQDLESSQRRWGAFITEAIPLLLSKLQLPLRFVLIAYSLSFNIFFLAVSALLTFRWRLYGLSILFACYYLLFVGPGYYWTNNEIHQSIAYIFLALGLSVVLYRRKSPLALQYTVFTVVSALAIFTHPLAIVAFSFLWLSLWIFRLDWELPFKQSAGYAIIIASWSVLKLFLSVNQAYDARRMHGITHLSADTLLQAFDGPVATAWFSACVNSYYASVAIAVVSIAVLLVKRRWRLAVWTLGAAAAFLALVHCGFPGGHFLYYLEGEWQTFGLIFGLPLVYALLPALGSRWSAVLIASLFILRLAEIYIASAPFASRVQYISSLTAYARRHHLPKIFIKAKDSSLESRLFMDWGLGTESMTMSALQGDYPQYTLCAYWPDHKERIPQNNSELVWNFSVRPARDLNPHYFATDTSVPYVIVPYEDIEAELPK